MNIIETDYGMTYVPFINTELISPFAPEWRFYIAEKILSRIDCNRLKNYLLSKQPEILAIKDKLTDAGTGLGNDSTTARFRSYNVMTWDQPDINILKEEISIMHDNYYRDIVDRPTPEISLGGWMNIMKKGDRIKRHNHGFLDNTYISGHFTVCCDSTRTVYTNPYEHWDEFELLKRVEEYGLEFNHSLYASKNTAGQLTLFPGYIPHFTTEHRSDSDRITLAFEIIPEYETII
tara:strand:- start:29 stop:730 length:702 start_codon:yes stop_codon:yes gene_type:complete